MSRLCGLGFVGLDTRLTIGNDPTDSERVSIVPDDLRKQFLYPDLQQPDRTSYRSMVPGEKCSQKKHNQNQNRNHDHNNIQKR